MGNSLFKRNICKNKKNTKDTKDTFKNILLLSDDEEKYILDSQYVKESIKIIDKFNKLYKNYILIFKSNKSTDFRKIIPNEKEKLENNISEYLLTFSETNNTSFDITKKKYILHNIEIQLYNLSFNYDTIICELNTLYNKNMYKLNNSSDNIKKITSYIINLKNKEITPKILEIGEYNKFMI